MVSQEERCKVMIVSTSNYSFKFFLEKRIRGLAEKNDVILVSNTEDGEPVLSTGVDFVPIPIRRSPHPTSDLANLVRLWRLMRREKPDVVYTITPKGGLLGAVAAWIARVPLRVNLFIGQVWVTRTGMQRTLLRSMDAIIGYVSTYALVDSPSQRKFLMYEGIVEERYSHVLGSGSISGVELDRFRRNLSDRSKIRSELKLSDDDVLIIYLGRLAFDKGVRHLVEAFGTIASAHPQAHLAFVGRDEGEKEYLLQRSAYLRLSDRIAFIDGTSSPEQYFSAADICCLPSYREGFPVTALEASSSSLPMVASRIYGIEDAIVDGETGLLHEVRNEADLVSKLNILLTDRELMHRMGKAARLRCESHFSSTANTAQFIRFHEDLLDGQPRRNIQKEAART